MANGSDIFRWLVDTSSAAGVLLAFAYGVMLVVKQPARRLRVGELALAGCLAVAAMQAVPGTRFSLGIVETSQPVRLPWFDDGGGLRGAASVGQGPVTSSEHVAPTVARRGAVLLYARYWREGLVGLYGLGVAVMAGQLVAAWVVLNRFRRRGRRAEGELAELWRSLIEGGREVTPTHRKPGATWDIPLVISGDIDRPLTFGLWRPVVLLPMSLVGAERGDLRAVLQHELGHVERHDAGAWMLAAVVNVVLFFLPPLWLMKRQMRLAQEFLADRAAADSAGGAVAYAEMMLRLVEMTGHERKGRVGASLAVGAWLAPSDLMVRVKHLFAVRSLERRCTRRWTVATAVCVLALTATLGAVTLAPARDDSLASKVRADELRGVAYLLSRQDGHGGWLTEMGPAPTALVVRSLLQAGVPADHPAIVRARAYAASCLQSDGGYYTDGEPTYHTAVVLSMYAALGDAEAAGRVAAGRKFLERELARPQAAVGAWYGSGGDGSGGGIASAAGPMRFADPSERGELGERAADAILESYGSITYDRWKSLVYAGLSESDPRVKRASKWLSQNWTLEKHPGTGSAEGLFYYYLAAAKTLRAAGGDRLMDKQGHRHLWREELQRKLLAAQGADGSWRNLKSPRWLEGRGEMVTAYALLALQETRK